MITRFVGKVHEIGNSLSITPDNFTIQDTIPCHVAQGVKHDFKEGDWAVAEMRYHSLKHTCYAELIQFITYDNDYFLPWWVTLARYNLEKDPPNGVVTKMFDEDLERYDFTVLDFITIDNSATKDIDDALYIEEGSDGKLCLTVAIADPTAWITEGSALDQSAKTRAFTNYLPNFNVPILPRTLSDDLCSLHPNVVRPALACRMTFTSDGAIEDNVTFFAITIRSKAKLTYDDVSDWLEKTGEWQPESESIAIQIRLLHHFYLNRYVWRSTHALVYQDRPDYHFVLSKKGEVLNIVTSPRRIANRIVEESMLAANISAARLLRDRLGFGVYNIHTGFNPNRTQALISLLKTHNINIDSKEILTLAGFCKLHRKLDTHLFSFLTRLIRRFQSSAEISTEPCPHFSLGFEVYATWTSPIRKYGDMINHRLLKAILKGKSVTCPEKKTISHMNERRRLNRIARRDVSNWLYARFLNDKAGTRMLFIAEILNINRRGMRIRLINNGAIAYIPALFLHTVRNEVLCDYESGCVQIKGKTIYKVTELIHVTITEVRMETRSIIARPIHY